MTTTLPTQHPASTPAPASAQPAATHSAELATWFESLRQPPAPAPAAATTPRAENGWD